MKRTINTLVLTLVLLLSMFTLMACSAGDDDLQAGEFHFSRALDENGFWRGINALHYVELCDYRAILVPADVHRVSKERIQSEINAIMSEFASDDIIMEGEVALGDRVNIDFVGTIDGVEFAGGSTGGGGMQVIIGVTPFIDGFLYQLIGHQPGDTVYVRVTFPEDYGVEGLDGQEALFVTTINYIVGERVIPELTDDFVATMLSIHYGVFTADELRELIESWHRNSAVFNYVREYLLENSVVKSTPDIILNHLKGMLIAQEERQAEAFGMSLDELLSLRGIENTDELIVNHLEELKENAVFHLIVQAIAEEEGIFIDDDELEYLFGQRFGDDLDFSMNEQIFGRPYMKFAVIYHTVVELLIEIAILA